MMYDETSLYKIVLPMLKKLIPYINMIMIQLKKSTLSDKAPTTSTMSNICKRDLCIYN